jgi:hypothetical protein
VPAPRGPEGVHIHCGDANGSDTLDAVFRAVPRNALVIAYLDPQGLDLHIDTVRALACTTGDSTFYSICRSMASCVT